ncbi:MAG: peptidylprolyl isomerase, partial [Candidatus Cryptobacteroides sp.]
VINRFMIQTGDPLTRDSSNVELYGTGGPDYTVPAEFVNEYFHKKGALAAARRGDTANPRKSSSGSQFYIVQDEMNCLHLDGQYTVFGETVEGLDVIDRIASAETDRFDRPLKDIRIISIRPVCVEAPSEADSTSVESIDSLGLKTVNGDVRTEKPAFQTKNDEKF